jgi:hypothetical protein
MKKLQLALAALALVSAAPALAGDRGSNLTTGNRPGTKPTAQLSAPSRNASVTITSGAWVPTKPSARQAGTSTPSAAVATGPVTPNKPGARPVPSR